jgi:superfamily II DNA/RNA helicase
VEQDEQRESATVTRSQNVVLTIPHDWRAIPQFMTPALERLDPESDATQLLVLTPDAESTVAVAQAARAAAGDEGAARVVAATSARRAARVLASGPAHAVVGTPA